MLVVVMCVELERVLLFVVVVWDWGVHFA